MKIAVLEYLCGAGCFNGPLGIPADDGSSSESPVANGLDGLWREGYAMLHAMAVDLQHAGHRVVTCFDRGLTQSISTESFDEVHLFDGVSNGGEQWIEKWIGIALQCDKTIVIAPEIDGLLQYAVGRLRDRGVDVVASTNEFLAQTGDKLKTAMLSRSHALLHPKTTLLSHWLDELGTEMGLLPKMSFRWVVKSRDGAGCNDMLVFESAASVEKYFRSDPNGVSKSTEHLVVQEWVPGRACSTAVLCGSAMRKVLGAVEQHLTLVPNGDELERFTVKYIGGCGPLLALENRELQAFVDSVLECFVGGSGWIGIDFVIAEDGSLYLIEINPRLTTSYLGYRQWYGERIARALVDDEVGLVTGEPNQNTNDWRNFPPIVFSQFTAG